MKPGICSPGGVLASGPPSTPTISIIIPVLNEAPDILAETLSGLPRASDLEILLVDGGSFRRHPASGGLLPSCPAVDGSPGGRGAQMNAGARVARGDLLVFPPCRHYP